MVILTEDEFDQILETADNVRMPNDRYIPSEEEIFSYIWKCPEKYYRYLIWYSEHRPEPHTEEEKKRLKNITKIINRSILIEPFDSAQKGETS